MLAASAYCATRHANAAAERYVQLLVSGHRAASISSGPFAQPHCEKTADKAEGGVTLSRSVLEY
jgi:hypothetical protein